MAELTIPEAAAALGVHIETVRRRIRRGELQARRDSRGRFLVDLPGTVPEAAPTQRVRMRSGADAAAYVDLRQQRDELMQTLRSSQEALEREQVASSELRRLLGNAQQQLQLLLRAPAEEQRRESVLAANGTPSASWWREFRAGKRGLGASLTLTGAAAGIAGIILHVAIQHNVIATETHLGYVIGLAGLLTFLIGLVLVF